MDEHTKSPVLGRIQAGCGQSNKYCPAAMYQRNNNTDTVPPARPSNIMKRHKRQAHRSPKTQNTHQNGFSGRLSRLLDTKPNESRIKTDSSMMSIIGAESPSETLGEAAFEMTAFDEQPPQLLALDMRLRRLEFMINSDLHHRPRNRFKRWAAETTMHGPIHLIRSPTFTGRFFWLTLIFISFCIMIPQLYTLIGVYFDPRSNWQTTIFEHNLEHSGLTFPTMYMCNFNRLKRSAAERWNFSEDLIIEYFDGDNLYPLRRSDNLSGVDAERLSAYLEQHKLNMRSALDAMAPTCEDTVFSVKTSLILSQNSELNYTKSADLCHARISENEFFEFRYEYTSNSGRCLRFNVADSVRVKRPGPNGGISLILDVQTEEYMTHLVNNYIDTGFMIGFSYGEEIEWITASAGYHLWVGMQKEQRSLKLTEFTSLWKPPGCIMEPNMTVIDNKLYSTEKCAFDCHMAEFARRCGCVATIIPVKHYNMCKYDSECSLEQTDIIGLDPYSETTDPVVTKCKDKCMPLCNSQSINVALSMNKFLTDEQATRLMHRFEKGRFNNTDQLKRSVVLMDLYFRTLSEKIIEKKLTITVDQLISQIGGQLGLWLGVSMLSLVHAVLCIVSSLWSTFKYKCLHNHKQ